MRRKLVITYLLIFSVVLVFFYLYIVSTTKPDPPRPDPPKPSIIHNTISVTIPNNNIPNNTPNDIPNNIPNTDIPNNIIPNTDIPNTIDSGIKSDTTDPNTIPNNNSPNEKIQSDDFKNDTLSTSIGMRKPSNESGVAAIVEWRVCNLFVSTIFNAIENLPSNWVIQIFHSKANENFIKNHPKLVPLQKEGKVHFTQISPEYGGHELNPHGQHIKNYYNALLTSFWFWDAVLNENCVIFQLDSRFCSNSPHRIEEFLEYSYVGAPWYHHPCWGNIVPVGNGGLSLRKKSVMLEVLQYRTEARSQIYQDSSLALCGDIDAAEDTVFSWGVHYLFHYRHFSHIKLPTKEIALKFSQENFFSGTPPPYLRGFAIHQANEYGAEIVKWCPEILPARQGCQEIRD